MSHDIPFSMLKEYVLSVNIHQVFVTLCVTCLFLPLSQYYQAKRLKSQLQWTRYVLTQYFSEQFSDEIMEPLICSQAVWLYKCPFLINDSQMVFFCMLGLLGRLTCSNFLSPLLHCSLVIIMTSFQRFNDLSFSSM